jgi:membrane fusion protein (multidrug efflux system)
VWVLKNDGTVQSAVIDPLAAWNNDIIVQSGLKAGDRIVVEGLAKLRPGVKVVDLGTGASSPAAGTAAARQVPGTTADPATIPQAKPGS